MEEFRINDNSLLNILVFAHSNHCCITVFLKLTTKSTSVQRTISVVFIRLLIKVFHCITYSTHETYT